ncbi:MAG: segregation/condensation protein A [Actinobacteria bacterium]|nr:segregation/condensation protein A [Actinomycetota bacterium]
MAFAVSTAVFEGPFDLLLHLISREEVDIYAVTLSDIVDAYLVELERMERLDLEVATEFLLIAATLVELKARRLLPGRSEFELDDELLFEERDLLLARLMECKTFKDAAQALNALRREARKSVPRTAGPEEPFASLAPDPLEHVGLERFLLAAVRAFTPREQVTVSLAHIAPIRASVRDAIDEVLALVPPGGAISFRRLTAGLAERLDIVVRFLAVLELYKRGAVDIDQPHALGELTIRLADPELTLADVDLTGLDEWGADEGEDEGEAVIDLRPEAPVDPGVLR